MASSTHVLGKSLLTAYQIVDSRVVLGSRVHLRVSKDGQVTLWGADTTPMRDATWSSYTTAENAAAILADFTQINEYKIIESQELWVRDGTRIIPAFKIKLEGRKLLDYPVGLVNALNGEILGYQNEIFNETISGIIQGPVVPENPFDEVELRPFRNQEITLGPVTTSTAIDGSYLFTDLLTGAEYGFSTQLSSEWALVERYSPPSASFDTTISSPNTFDFNWENGIDGNISEFNLFYHINYIHDWYKQLDPDYTGMDLQLMVYCEVDMIPGNAGFIPMGPTMMFGTDVPGEVEGLDLSADVIYHEYTHGIAWYQYNENISMEGQSGAMMEGWADYAAASIHDDPNMGEGTILTQPDGVIRHLDNENRYPEDIEDEVHADGLIIGGAMWHTREALGAEITDPLFHYARYGMPVTFEEYLLSVLETDDDNNDLSDGTPHSEEIVEQFSLHGIGGSDDFILDIYDFQLIDTNQDGLFHQGEDVEVSITLQNSSWEFAAPLENVTIIASPVEGIAWSVTEVDLGTIASSEIVTIPFNLQFAISDDATDGYLPLTFTISANDGDFISVENKRLRVGTPEILLVNDSGSDEINEAFIDIIDGVGTIRQRETLGNAIIVTVDVPESLARYMINKGSVALDGISLTINRCDAESFAVSIIPHTAKLTTIGFKKNGDPVNIETDMLGKYVERFMTARAHRNKEEAGKSSAIDKAYLLKTGFID